jgi:3-carboxy-cis,cis-muconate cycloisomerase
MLDAEIALAQAQAGIGLIPDAVADAIDGVFEELDPAELAVRARAGGNPVIPLVEDLKKKVDPHLADFVHLGATSQDILDTALMLVAKRGIRLIDADLGTAVDALAGLADAHRATPMAARSLTQQSLPTTFGLKAAGWLMIVADARSFLGAVATALPAQLGGAAGTLASFRELAPGHELELVELYAARLELQAPPLPWHTARTPVLRLADALSAVGAALGKVAVDVALLSRTEIGELHEATGGGSSSMPQKQNPVRSILISSATRSIPGLSTELHRSAVAIDERPDGAWHAEWQALRELLRATGGAASLAADLLPGLRVDADRMHANLALTGPLIVSERINLVLRPVLGAAGVKDLIAASAEDPAGLGDRIRAALPEGSDVDLADLLDPLAYLGIDDELIDRALAHAGRTP